MTVLARLAEGCLKSAMGLGAVLASQVVALDLSNVVGWVDGTGSVTAPVSSSGSWTATSDSGWITPSASSGNGNGAVTLNFDTSGTGAAKLLIAGVEYKIVQFGLETVAPVLNLSTRGRIGTGDDVLIGGIIIQGSGTKRVLVTGRGQSISSTVPGRISDPKLSLLSGATVIASSDNWPSESNASAIAALPQMPASNTHASDAALLMDLGPGAYTAIVDGVGGGQGIGIVEIFDLEINSTATLANLSTRGAVGTGDNVLIAGVVVGGIVGESATLVFRGRRPNVPAGFLADPTLTFYDGATPYLTNDNWGIGSSASQLTGIYSSYAPSGAFDAAEVQVRPSNSATTSILSGLWGQTGIGIVEVFVP